MQMSAPALKAEQEIAFAVSNIKDKYKVWSMLMFIFGVLVFFQF